MSCSLGFVFSSPHQPGPLCKLISFLHPFVSCPGVPRFLVIWLLFRLRSECRHIGFQSDSSSNLIFRPDCPHVFTKYPNGIWPCSDWVALLTHLTDCCSNNVGTETSSSSSCVGRHRSALGCPPYAPQPPPVDDYM